MKNMKKILVFAMAMLLVMALSVGGTLAWLTHTSNEVKNTFTVGDIEIRLDEAEVEYKNDLNYWKDTGDRVTTNTYKILPGVMIDKDPTVYVAADSENCYVRAVITITYAQELDTWFAANGVNPIADWVTWNANWSKPDAPYSVTKDDTAKTVTRKYEVRYTGGNNGIVARNATTEQELPEIFSLITIPKNLDNAAIALLANFKIDVIAHAIQSDGFTSADLAWAELALPR